MKIIEALPKTKYVAALKHSTTPKFQELKKKSINRFKAMWRDPRINHDVTPGLWFGGGKDSMAVALLAAHAGIEVNHLSINNGGDFAGHERVFPEWRSFYEKKFGKKPKEKYYQTEMRYPLLIKKYFKWAEDNGLTGLNFWNWGEMVDTLNYETTFKFDEDYLSEHFNPMMIMGSRGGEGQERAFKIARNGLLWAVNHEDDRIEKYCPYVSALPIGDWIDMDVWAFLIENEAPVSPIYSYHEIAQKNGNRKYPRTLWYCSPLHFCATFYKWMARYVPSQLDELCNLFPEIPERLARKS